mmetsp:Transcript_10053/g.31840  ORF Transcript_10053/g.31840 Transcript_10053/m.31840 type:complete len:274 (+) Transcript_10053:41-862(+)
MLSAQLLALQPHALSTPALTPTRRGSSFWSEPWTEPLLFQSAWRMTLDIQSGGARLAVPLEITFSDEPVAGGDFRWTVEEPTCCPARRLLASAGTFVGPQGEVSVEARPGGWLAEPPDRCGRSALRFYIDFPDGAQRNGAELPPGRAYFRAACWDGAQLRQFEAEAAAVRAELDALGAAAEASASLGLSAERAEAAMPSERRQLLEYQLEIIEHSMPDERGVLPGPGDLQMAAGGELSIKTDSVANMWGLIRSNFDTIGGFTLAPIRPAGAEL